jgi:hypothetical protein
VVFFGQLASRADVAVSTVTPQLRTELVAAGVQSPVVNADVAQFTRCFKARASSSDPLQPIPGCPQPTASASSNPVSAAFASAAKHALARDFVTTIERILFFNVGLWFLTGVLSLLLPRVQVRAH